MKFFKILLSGIIMVAIPIILQIISPSYIGYTGYIFLGFVIGGIFYSIWTIIENFHNK